VSDWTVSSASVLPVELPLSEEGLAVSSSLPQESQDCCHVPEIKQALPVHRHVVQDLVDFVDAVENGRAT
jgi:hypothetical protein